MPTPGSFQPSHRTSSALIASSFAAAVALFATGAVGQMTTGSIEGVVVGEEGRGLWGKGELRQVVAVANCEINANDVISNHTI